MRFWWQSFLKPKKNPEKDLDALVQGLKSTLGDRLKSVVVFGSMASGEFHSEHSDVNVLVVANLAPDALRLMGLAMKAWVKKGHTPPVMAAPDDLAGMARSFPIEFLDMIDHHKVLFGNDPLTGLSVDPRHLRAQCEHDLALVRLRLRQAISVANGDAGKLRHALIGSLPSVLTLVRAAVRLEENGKKLDRIKAADCLAERVGFEVSVLHRMSDLKLQRATDDLNDLAVQYLGVIEMVLKYLRKS